jgi:CheY-like chemotaxis protein
MNANPETILVVDDEPMVIGLCRTILPLGGYNALFANNGDEALKLLNDRNAPIDLALLDVMMPRMNGVELADRILATHPTTKIVFMSEFSLKEIASVMGERSHRIIWKPFKTESLLRDLENTLKST